MSIVYENIAIPFLIFHSAVLLQIIYLSIVCPSTQIYNF